MRITDLVENSLNGIYKTFNFESKEKRHERKEPKYSANWLLKKISFSKNMSEVIQAIKKEVTTSQKLNVRQTLHSKSSSAFLTVDEEPCTIANTP